MVVVSAVLFFMIVIMIELFLSLIRGETASEVLTKITGSNFILSKIIGAVVYGIIIAFFYKRKAKKIQKK